MRFHQAQVTGLGWAPGNDVWGWTQRYFTPSYNTISPVLYWILLGDQVVTPPDGWAVVCTGPAVVCTGRAVVCTGRAVVCTGWAVVGGL